MNANSISPDLMAEITQKVENLSSLGIYNLDMESEYGLTTEEVKILKSQLYEERKKSLAKVELAELQVDYKYDVKLKEDFLRWNKNYSEIRYEEITDSANHILTVGNKIDNIKGYKINGKGYAIELLACDRNRNSCAFRVNGVPTKRIYQKDVDEEPKSFDLGDGSVLMIDSIEFDKCDYGVCDLHYDGYDAVDVGVVEG